MVSGSGKKPLSSIFHGKRSLPTFLLGSLPLCLFELEFHRTDFPLGTCFGIPRQFPKAAHSLRPTVESGQPSPDPTTLRDKQTTLQEEEPKGPSGKTLVAKQISMEERFPSLCPLAMMQTDLGFPYSLLSHVWVRIAFSPASGCGISPV